MKPQTARTLAVLRARGAEGLSHLEALELVHTARLAARIYELEAEGHAITRTLETAPSGARYARYRIVERPVQLTLLGPAPSVAPADPPGRSSRARQSAEALAAGSRSG